MCFVTEKVSYWNYHCNHHLPDAFCQRRSKRRDRIITVFVGSRPESAVSRHARSTQKEQIHIHSGAAELTHGKEWVIWRYIFSVNSTKKPTCGRRKESKAANESGSIPRMWCGPKLLARAVFGMEAVKEAFVVLGCWLVFTQTLEWLTIHKKVRTSAWPEFPWCRVGWLCYVDESFESVDRQNYAWALHVNLSLSPQCSFFLHAGGPWPSPPTLGPWVTYPRRWDK